MYFCTLLVQSRHLFYLFIFSGRFLFLCAVNFPSNEDESGKAYKRRSWISVRDSGPIRPNVQQVEDKGLEKACAFCNKMHLGFFFFLIYNHLFQKMENSHLYF